MSDGMKVGRNGDPPLFYVSYARTPTLGGMTGWDPDKLVEIFFRDLCERVAEDIGLPADGAVGFIDRETAGSEPGDVSPEAREVLATCRVFVPLYSPRYFASERCGREWSAFVARAPAGYVVPIVRVSWAPVPLASLPVVAMDVRSDDSHASGWYLAEGLYSLMTLEENDDYQRTVADLSRQIVIAARLPYPVSDRPVDLEDVLNAFARPPKPPLRVIVLAPTTSRLPPRREPACYGPSPLDWNPYQLSAGRPLSDDLTGLARNLDFEPELIAFDDAIEMLLREDRPAAPGVLIVDVWALADPGWREVLREFDGLTRPWISVLAVLNPRDRQTDRHAEYLSELLRDTLTRRNTGGRVVSRLAARGAQTMEEFVRSFSAMAETAGIQYLMHSRGIRRRETDVTLPGPENHGGNQDNPEAWRDQRS
jgi:FxsC-like protein